MQTQPDYPFFTCWQKIYFRGYFALDCSIRIKQADSACGASIAWDVMDRSPDFIGNERYPGEQVIPGVEFRAALLIVENEISAFVALRLPLVPVAYCTNEQSKEINRLVSHPLITRPEKTMALLAINKLECHHATAYIAQLSQLINKRENQPFSVSAEAFIIDTTAA